MTTFKFWLNENENNIVIFTTAKGSKYQFNCRQTRREKSFHQLHDPKDVGIKEVSQRTIFIYQNFASEIGMWGSSSSRKKRIIVDNRRQQIHLLSWNDTANKFGRDKIISSNTFSNTPAIGLCPLELWQRDETPYPWLKTDMEVYKVRHPGNQIISFGGQFF